MKIDDRMKLYERSGNGKRLVPLLPAFARLDGRSFHSFTRDLKRPYDERLSTLMTELTKWLVRETSSCCGYAQSDEITLAWYTEDVSTQIFFDGKIDKINSVLASMTSVRFNKMLCDYLPCKTECEPVFDCRCWTVPTLDEGANVFVWRELDATRNSVSAAAQANFSHKELQGKKVTEMQDMLMLEKGINWNDYPSFFKRGTYVQRRKVLRKFTTDELEKLPIKHEARLNPDLEIRRSEVGTLDMPPILQVVNRVDVLFRGVLAKKSIED